MLSERLLCFRRRRLAPRAGKPAMGTCKVGFAWRELVVGVVTGMVLNCLIVFIFLVSSARADYFKYTDSKGTVCITNSLENVPPRYRKSMKVIKDDAPAKDKGTPQSAGQESSTEVLSQPLPAPPETKDDRFFARFPWVKPVMAIIGVVVAFFLVGRLASILPSPHLTRIVYLAFFAGVFVFAYKAYANYMVSSYFTIKNKVLTMFKKSNERQAPEAGERSVSGDRLKDASQ